MNISKFIFATVFTLSLSFSSFANSSFDEGSVKNIFKTTFSTKVENKAIANIENNKGIITVMLTDEQGNILHEKRITAEKVKYSINLAKLPKGTYFLQVIGEDKSTYETYYVR
ncbi:DUF3244 domain-containing protein [Bernardetia sp.]|uniref:DUF3244 domain-containing protein n=1 Tax=Bernardetia sp. TaxID=1937974 RepID=UPI0025BACD9F|nr:T9SS type A sorting domain-containing protein [Bernardetia sp.]